MNVKWMIGLCLLVSASIGHAGGAGTRGGGGGYIGPDEASGAIENQVFIDYETEEGYARGFQCMPDTPRPCLTEGDITFICPGDSDRLVVLVCHDGRWTEKESQGRHENGLLQKVNGGGIRRNQTDHHWSEESRGLFYSDEPPCTKESEGRHWVTVTERGVVLDRICKSGFWKFMEPKKDQET